MRNVLPGNRRALPPEINFAEASSMDTKHILAWVKENNPKAYVLEGDRLDKTRQPTGDRECRLELFVADRLHEVAGGSGVTDSAVDRCGGEKERSE